MRTDVLLFEVLMLGLLAWVLVTAARQGPARVAEVMAGFLYGVLLEWLTLHQLQAYRYGEFLLMLDGAPLCIGAGWAVILYAAMEFTDRTTLPESVRPLADGLLALNIDLAMDAIAIRQTFWTWGTTPIEADWFGVPWGNFWAWLIVVAAFSYWIRWFRRQRWPTRPIRRWLFGPLVILLALAILLPTNWLMKSILMEAGLAFAGMALLIGTSLLIVALARPRFIPDAPLPAVATVVPLAFHLYFMTIGVLLGFYAQHPTLAVTGLLMLALSLILQRQQRRAGYADGR